MSSSGEEWMEEELGPIRKRIQGYFGDSKNFKLDRFLGKGVTAHAWLIRHRKQEKDPWQKLVLKTPAYVEGSLREQQFANGPEGVTEFHEEAGLLKLIRTRHLVRLIDFCGQDPLNQNGARNYFGNWIYLEYLENGNLAEFLEKCEAHSIPYVPNRLLWRMFLCMIRACIAMAYIPPGDPVDRYDQNEEPCEDSKGSYTHVDMHSKNIMLGALLGDPDDLEHAISPPVKFIDLDNHVLFDGGEGEGVQENVFHVGANMAQVILRDDEACLDTLEAYEDDDTDPVQLRLPGKPTFQTYAEKMLPNDDTDFTMPRPELDPDLRFLICLCCAARKETRPRLADQLLPWVLAAVRQRDAAYYDRTPYCDGEEETDECILLFLQTVLGAAPPPAKGEGGGPESMDIDDSGPGTSRSGKLKTRDARETSPRPLTTDPQDRFRQRSPLTDRDDKMDLG
ncbi:hypothetical protein PG985_011650 [Apiospora marii]|uniref:Protein kinase domain-containing protein n=1 Tax=Apiospora marii TaxID=335849 RepID=A0ABR1R0G6_9PEZI